MRQPALQKSARGLQSSRNKIVSNGRLKPHRPQLTQTPGEHERAAALSHINRSRRRVRRARVLIFASGNPISQSEIWWGWQRRRRIRRILRFCPAGKTAAAQIEKFEPRHLAGELAPPSNRFSVQILSVFTSKVWKYSLTQLPRPAAPRTCSRAGRRPRPFRRGR